MSVKNFVEKLASYQANSRSFNQYSYDYELGGSIRRNLLIYLEEMRNIGYRKLLVGEAPGYHGCRWSGIPFTSERIIEERRAPLFVSKQDFYVSSHVHAEQTASIIWKTLNELNLYPLMWNAYPFHPYQSNDPTKNRKPTIEELKSGQVFLEELIELFEIETVIAIGRKAEDTLRTIGINCHEVRHPSHGGKQQFIQGMRNYLR